MMWDLKWLKPVKPVGPVVPTGHTGLAQTDRKNFGFSDLSCELN